MPPSLSFSLPQHGSQAPTWREWRSSQWSWGLCPLISPTGAGDLPNAGAKPQDSVCRARPQHRPPGQKPRGSLGKLHSVHGAPRLACSGVRTCDHRQGCARAGWGQGQRNMAQSFRHLLAGQGFFHSLLLAWIQEAPGRRHSGYSMPGQLRSSSWPVPRELGFSVLELEADPV